jgi:hypothetical protein
MSEMALLFEMAPASSVHYAHKSDVKMQTSMKQLWSDTGRRKTEKSGKPFFFFTATFYAINLHVTWPGIEPGSPNSECSTTNLLGRVLIFLLVSNSAAGLSENAQKRRGVLSKPL